MESDYSVEVNPKLQANATGEIYQAIKDFKPRLEDELPLQVGEKIEVISDDSEYNDGWYMGRSLSNGKVGLYPKTFTRPVPREDQKLKPTLLRSRSRRIISPVSASNSVPQTPISPQIQSFRVSLNNKSEVTTPTSPSNHFNDNKSLKKKDTIPSSNDFSELDQAIRELKTGSISSAPIAPPLNISKDELSDVSMTSLSPDYIDTWTAEQVTQYFLALGFDAKDCEQFTIHKITGALLLEFELSYLKELEISSFGTRFEMFKEIEALQKYTAEYNTSNMSSSIPAHSSLQNSRSNLDARNSSTSSSLLEPPEVHRSSGISSTLENDLDTFTRPLANHQRKKSRSLGDIPELSKYQVYGDTSHVNQSSKISTVSHLPIPDLPSLKSPVKEQFLSPRKAPNPPPFPSPVQLHPERYPVQNTPTRSSIYESQSKGHSRKPSYDINPQFQFNPSSSFVKPATASSRTPSIDFGGSHLKSRSVIDFTNDDRSPSSIYQDGTVPNRSRRSSFAGLKSHSRRASEASFVKPTLKEDKLLHHRRHSSLFSFRSSSKENYLQDQVPPPSKVSPTRPVSMLINQGEDHLDLFDAPSGNRFSFLSRGSEKKQISPPPLAPIPTLDPNAKIRSVSANDRLRIDTTNLNNEDSSSLPNSADSKRSVSDAVRMKTLRNISMATTPTMTKKNNNKKDTSAFMEGIKYVTPSESLKTSQYHGWMNKKGGLAVGTWKQRYFVLHGTRLSYFSSLDDKKERGLIDITSHRVLPAKDDDKLIALYAATTGNGKFCFKLVPPAPGSRKGLTFTQPKVHYFAVETKEEMRTWMAALIKATIDKDESVPVLSSCATPTVSLQKAQNLLAQARENAKRRELDCVITSNNSSISPADSDSFDSFPNFSNSPNTTVTTGDLHHNNNTLPLQTPITECANGFSSPYDIANMTSTKNRLSKSAGPSPVEEFKAKPYNAGTIRHPSTRLPSSQSVPYYAGEENYVNTSGNLPNGNRL